MLADGTIDPRNQPFTPQYPLWTDGATKRRWLALPPGQRIDASDPDDWRFPVGTRVWKEFSFAGRPVETRFMQRLPDGSWRYATYAWRADGAEADLVGPFGRRKAYPLGDGLFHAIPSRADCKACHEGRESRVLGFSALQLSPDRDPAAPHANAFSGADLRTLAARGLLRNLPPSVLAHPPRIAAATARERSALGYLHGNCGHCHNADGPLSIFELDLSQRVTGSAADVLRTLVGVPSQVRAPQAPVGTPRIAPGHFSASALAIRMRSRDPLQQMPPLGTTQVDAEALALLAAWVDGLSN